ncbi:hypothetical protein FQN54_001383 [Arachnomyces sp. PD_36]|nr:hypothetical protein FQN54_001383 [Arachnomyces sp. PD_36]
MEEHEIVNAREWQLEGDEVGPRPTGSGHLGPANGAWGPTLGLNGPQTENKPSARIRKNSEPATRPKALARIGGRGRGQPLKGGGHMGGNSRNISPRFVPAWARQPTANGPPNRKPAGANQTVGRYGRGSKMSPVKGAGRYPTEAFNLPTTVAGMKDAFSSGKSSAFIDAIDNVKKTGVTVLELRNYSSAILIRGTPEQKEASRAILQKVVASYNSMRPSTSEVKPKGFAKIYSYFQHKETRIDRLAKQEDFLRNLRQPHPSIKFAQTLLFLWPEDELPMKSSLGPNLEQLDPIRMEFQCRIYMYDGAADFIRVDGDDQDMKAIARRLRNKWAELMASVNVKAKLYLAQPPSTEAMKAEVDINKLDHRGGGFAYASPSLYGKPLGGVQRQQWAEKILQIKSKNDGRLRDTVERSLQGLRFLRGHIRMRVHLGAFVLDDYRIPTGSKPRHSFVDFRQMLLHDKTRGHLIPGLVPGHGEGNLVHKCANATDLLEPFEATALSLDTIEPVYAVNFEFSNAGNSALFLEIEFIRFPGSRQFEVNQLRWVKPQGGDKVGGKRAPLQVGVIDFERADWQLEIKALEFHPASNIDQALREFAHSVKFKADNLNAAEVRRKVEFPGTVPISRLIEKSAWRYRLKGTRYVFELARYDEYRRAGMAISQGRPVQPPPNQLTLAPVTSWGGSIFDINWDNMLGKQANYGTGRSAEWRPTLNTFFPASEASDPRDTSAGFSELLGLVTKITELLHTKPAEGGLVKNEPRKEAENEKAKAVDKQIDKKDGGQKVDNKRRWADVLIDSGAIF